MGGAWRRAHWRPYRRCGPRGSRARSADSILVRTWRLRGGRRDACDLLALDHPTNQLTANWTALPDNWEPLWRQSEYGHAANTILAFVGLCAVTWSALSYRE